MKLYGVYHFGQRNLVVTDIDLAKLILVKDADHFTESFAVGTDYKDAHGEIDKLFSLLLTNMKGDDWRKVSRACCSWSWRSNVKWVRLGQIS